MRLATDRYPSNRAACPPGARVKEADMQRALKLAEKAPAMRDLLARIAAARQFPALLELLAEEAGGLVAETGGAA